LKELHTLWVQPQNRKKILQVSEINRQNMQVEKNQQTPDPKDSEQKEASRNYDTK
jgi:hypothetical protein